MSLQKLNELKNQRQHTAVDGTIFRLRPVDSLKLALTGQGVMPNILFELWDNDGNEDLLPEEYKKEPLGLTEEQRFEWNKAREKELQQIKKVKLEEVLDKKGGAETLVAAQHMEAQMLFHGVVAPFKIFPTNSSEAPSENDCYYSEFVEAYPDDYPLIIEKIQRLSGVTKVKPESEEAKKTF